MLINVKKIGNEKDDLEDKIKSIKSVMGLDNRLRIEEE